MQWKFVLLGLGVAVCLGAASPAKAGGIGQVVIAKLHGRVEIKPLQAGGRWQRAKPGTLQGMYFCCEPVRGPGFTWATPKDALTATA